MLDMFQSGLLKLFTLLINTADKEIYSQNLFFFAPGFFAFPGFLPIFSCIKGGKKPRFRLYNIFNNFLLPLITSIQTGQTNKHTNKQTNKHKSSFKNKDIRLCLSLARFPGCGRYTSTWTILRASHILYTRFNLFILQLIIWIYYSEYFWILFYYWLRQQVRIDQLSNYSLIVGNSHFYPVMCNYLYLKRMEYI